MLIALLVCTFLFSVLLLNQIGDSLTRKQRTIEKRLQTTIGHHRENSARQFNSGLGVRRKALLRLQLPGAILTTKYMETLQVELIKAGLPLKAPELVLFTVISIAVFGLFGVILSGNVFIGLALGALVIVAAYLSIVTQKKRRALKVEDQLLNAIVLLANSLRAGHSFLQALELVSRETQPPLATELGRLLRETRVGVPLEEALVSLVERVESNDLEMLVTGVLIQRQVGGNLAEVLDNIAYTINRRIKMRAKVRALTAQGRLSAWVVSLLPFALAAFIFGRDPQYAQLMLTEPLGRGMLILGGVFLLIIYLHFPVSS